MNIETGKRVQLETPDFSGRAGMQGNKVAYTPQRLNKPVRVGELVTLDGVPVAVLAVEKSQYVRTMVVLTVDQ